MGGFGPFSSSSDTRSREWNVGNVTASEGGVAVVVNGSAKGAVLPGGTLYKVAKGGSIQLSVSSPAGGAGTILADAIQGQAAGAFGSLPNVPAAGGVDKKTAIVGAIVAVVLLAVLWFAGRRR